MAVTCDTELGTMSVTQQALSHRNNPQLLLEFVA